MPPAARSTSASSSTPCPPRPTSSTTPRSSREKALLRSLIQVSTGIVTDAFAGQHTAAELLDVAESRIFQVSQQRQNEGFTRIKELMWPAMERIEALQRGGKTITGVASGFNDLDEITSGFQPADLVIVAARPSMGKTALTLNIAQHAAIEQQRAGGVLLAGNEQGGARAAHAHQRGPRGRPATAEGHASRRRPAAARPRRRHPQLRRPSGSTTRPGLSLLEMRSKARRLKVDANVGLVIVDYLQLMSGPANAESRQQEISQISRGLKALAKELTVPVVALSQLSRAPELRTGENKRPQLSDLRESGAIEQDADLIMFLYRQEIYDGPTDKDGNSLEGKAEIIVGKQRNGPTGIVNLYFHKHYTRFENYTQRATGP